MIKPSRRTRDMGNAVVRRTTIAVAAACLVGTGAFAALQAKAYGDSNSSGGTKATGSEGLTSQKVVTSDDSHHEDHEDHEDHDDHGEHDDHADAGNSVSFSQPAAAPTTAPRSTGRVVSGGS